MPKVVVIGIDGLDADLLRVYGPSLPNLRRLMLASPFLELTSCFPPETGAAWASVYTGLNPARHGVLGKRAGETLQQIPEGRAFWDIASRAGKRVCIVNPTGVYSGRSVNGILLSEGFPALPHLNKLPVQSRLGALYQELSDLTLKQAEAALELFKREAWDVFSLQLDALDLVQHYFWRYSDPGDPAYPGRNQFSNAIHDFYHVLDQIVGCFRSYMPKDAVLVVVSGHGHGRSSSQQLQLNQWLSTRHLLKLRPGMRRFFHLRYLRERLKQRTIELLMKLQLPAAAAQLLGSVNEYVAYDRATYLIDQEATLAQAVGQGELCAFGGICLFRKRIEAQGREYEAVRERLLNELEQLKFQGRPLVRWAKKREAFYTGPYLEQYPDLLFELQSDLMVGEGLYTSLLTPAPVHYFVSGGHRRHGVLLFSEVPEGMALLEIEAEPGVMDVAPTLLSLLNVASAQFDGRALLLAEPAILKS